MTRQPTTPSHGTAMDPLRKLSRDIRAAASTLGRAEARFLVDAFYMMQEDRKRAHNQVRALADGEEPHEVTAWLAEQSEMLEKQIGKALLTYAEAHEVGRWSLEQKGVGGIIAAGLLAHIDLEPWKCARRTGPTDGCREASPHGPECHRIRIATAGQVWAFAGLDPTRSWDKGEKRPHNLKLKTLCAFKLGECLIKVSNMEDAYYGHLYAQRKQQEWERNQAGEFAAQAQAILDGPKPPGKTTDAIRWNAGCLTAADVQTYFATDLSKRQGLTKKLAGDPGSGVPMLAPDHIKSRARRYAVKLFLAHWHEVAYWDHFGEPPPKPYATEHLGHAHLLRPNGWSPPK